MWGEVGPDDPPHLVMPLTVEPSKPRLCLDARFLNLWMRDAPFVLDRLADVPRYVYKSSFITKCNDKSGYDHVMVTESSQTYVGFSFGGLWLVCRTLPFGWKISPYIYHTIGLAATGFLRSQGVPCSLYIDDRLNGELITATGRWAKLPQERPKDFRYEAAEAALYVVLSVLIAFGYTIGIKKSVLAPTTSLEYLGLTVDSEKQSFLIPQRKKESFAILRELILSSKQPIPLKTLQRFQGKCISFSLAVPAAKLFIREISKVRPERAGKDTVNLSEIQREEVSYWRFLDNWDESIAWRDEKHHTVSLSTDASGYGWGVSFTVRLETSLLEIIGRSMTRRLTSLLRR